MCCKPCSRCRWRWRLKRLLVRLFVVAVVCFVFSTRRRRLLAMPVRRWIRDKNQQLVVAHGARAVDGAGVCESYSGGSSSSPLAALCTLRVGGDGWHCQPAARCVQGLGSLKLQAMLLLSRAVASEKAACAALRRRCGVLCVLNSTAAIAGNAGTFTTRRRQIPGVASLPLVAW